MKGPRSLTTEGQQVTGRTAWRKRLVAAAVLLVVLATVTSRWQAAAPPGESRVAVLPFNYRGDTALAYLGPGMASLLIGALDGVGGLHAVDQRL